MASAELAQQLEEQLATVTRYEDSELISRRDDWGAITFDSAAQDIKTALSIALDLSAMPLIHITDQAAQDIRDAIPNVATSLEQIDDFKLQGDAERNRDDIAANLKNAVAQLHTVASQWIPYLAYKRGDFSENIKKFEETIKTATSQLDEASGLAKKTQEEVNSIVEATREASARAGVATFTHEFDAEADRLAVGSRWWLGMVALLAAISVTAAVSSFFWPPLADSATSWVVLRHVVAKVSLIAILFAATIWCGRIYRAIRHQRSINRHRALSLRTFQAFVRATDDPATRDAVLIAATRSIFANVPTGLVDERSVGQDASVNVLEIGKSAGKAAPTGRTASPDA